MTTNLADSNNIRLLSCGSVDCKCGHSVVQLLLFSSLFCCLGSCKAEGKASVELLCGGSGDNPASKFIHVVGRIQCHKVVGLRSLFPCWLSSSGGSQLLKPAHILLFGPLPPSSKPAAADRILLSLTFPLLHLWPSSSLKGD